MASAPSRFELFSTQQTKQLALVVKIDGLDDVLSSRPLYTRVQYGDPSIRYGDPGLVYGGLRKYMTPSGGTYQDILSFEGSSLSLSQKLEPEAGRASISQLSLAFIDRDQYMTRLVTPGVVLDEILGREVEVYLGYEEISYPQDYVRVFRGFISQVDAGPGLVTLSLSDPNLKRRGQVFFTAKDKLAAQADYQSRAIQDLTYFAAPGYGTGVSIAYTGGGTKGSEAVSVSGQAITVQIQAGASTASQIKSAVENHPTARTMVFVDVTGSSSNPQTTQAATFLQSATWLIVTQNTDFHAPILGPDGGFDAAIKSYVKIEDEWIQVFPHQGDHTKLIVIERGARGTQAIYHKAEAEMTAAVEIEDRAIDLALKVMLSGWGDSWIKGQPLAAIGPTPDPDAFVSTTDCITLPPGVDAVRDYGLVLGDYIYIEGSAVDPANNNTWYAIKGFGDGDDGGSNRVIFVDWTLVKEPGTPATVGFRSQYDTYPKSCGMKLTPRDVDVARHQEIRNQFLGVLESSYRFFIDEVVSSAKSWLEKEVYLPIGTYSLTRRGLLSMGITKPPVAESSLVFLSEDNVLDAQNIRPSRGTSSRSFYNEIQYYMDPTDEGEFTRIYKVLDSESLSLIGISSVLKIESQGSRSDLCSDTALDKISTFLLSRYRRGAVTFSVQVNWEAGCLIEAGDIVAVRDDDTLFIANFEDGTRNLGTKLFEVIERTLDLKSGKVQLKLISGIAGEAADRFATISPSSQVGVGSTPSTVVITDSYGALFPGNERKKWIEYIGQKIRVHSEDWAREGEATLMGFAASNPYHMVIEPPLGFTPQPGDVVDVQEYPTTPEKNDAQILKAIHAFLDPTVTVASGVSQTVFEVAPGDTGKFFVGAIVRVHAQDYARDSGDARVTAVDAGTNRITVGRAMGFTPVAGDQVDLIGFPDGGAAYRWL